MGATLPAVARWVEATPNGVSWLGFFYGSNLAGAVFGCLLAGFYLLRVHDMATATFVAAAVNSAVAIAGWAWAAVTPHAPPDRTAPRTAPSAPQGAMTVYLAIALRAACPRGRVVSTRSCLAARRHDVYLLHHPGRRAHRARDRQCRRRGAGARRATTPCGARRGAAPAARGHRVDGRHAHAVAPVLAHQPEPVAERLGRLPDGLRPLPVGAVPGHRPLGRQLSVCAGGRRVTGSGR